MKFYVGQKVTYVRLGKVGTILAVDVGLDYYVLIDGWVWSVPENSLIAKLGKRYRSSRKKLTLQNPQPEKLNNFAESANEKTPPFASESIKATQPRGRPQLPGDRRLKRKMAV